jgi:chromosome segregation ATPase
MISPMNINPAVLDQAVGLLDLIALVRDPGASKAVLEDFVAQRKAAEAAYQSADARLAAVAKELTKLDKATAKSEAAAQAAHEAHEACAIEQQKLSDARDDLERGRAEIKQARRDWGQMQTALVGEREAIVKQRASMEADFAQQREQIHAEQTDLDRRAAEVEAKDADLTARLAKLRALAGE